MIRKRTTEDVRLNPKPGDVLKGKRQMCTGNATKRTVTRTESHYVWFEYGGPKWQRVATKSEWRKWAAGAEVVRIAE